jgi:hypothetical protein
LSRHLHQSCILYLGLISGLAASFSAVLWLSVPFYRDGGGRGGAAGVVLAGLFVEMGTERALEGGGPSK